MYPLYLLLGVTLNEEIVLGKQSESVPVSYHNQEADIPIIPTTGGDTERGDCVRK